MNYIGAAKNIVLFYSNLPSTWSDSSPTSPLQILYYLRFDFPSKAFRDAIQIHARFLHPRLPSGYLEDVRHHDGSREQLALHLRPETLHDRRQAVDRDDVVPVQLRLPQIANMKQCAIPISRRDETSEISEKMEGGIDFVPDRPLEHALARGAEHDPSVTGSQIDKSQRSTSLLPLHVLRDRGMSSHHVEHQIKLVPERGQVRSAAAQ